MNLFYQHHISCLFGFCLSWPLILAQPAFRFFLLVIVTFCHTHCLWGSERSLGTNKETIFLATYGLNRRKQALCQNANHYNFKLKKTHLSYESVALPSFLWCLPAVARHHITRSGVNFPSVSQVWKARVARHVVRVVMGKVKADFHLAFKNLSDINQGKIWPIKSVINICQFLLNQQICITKRRNIMLKVPCRDF